MIEEIVDKLQNGVEVKLFVQDLNRMESLSKEIQALHPGKFYFKKRRHDLTYVPNGVRVDFFVIEELELLTGRPVVAILDKELNNGKRPSTN